MVFTGMIPVQPEKVRMAQSRFPVRRFDVVVRRT